MRGWELICICLFYFPPNKVFRDPLHAYLTTRSEALSVAMTSNDSSTVNTYTNTNNSASSGPLRPGPSLAAAAALAAGSDPTGLVSEPITPAFGVPLATDVGGLDLGPSADLNASLASSSNVAETSGGAQTNDFPYGPWVKLSALHFTRAAPRWFMRSVAVGAARSAATPPSKEELLHVKVSTF